MAFLSKKSLRFHSDFNAFELGFLNAREYDWLLLILKTLSEKGDKLSAVDIVEIKRLYFKNLPYKSLTALVMSLKDKLVSNGFIGNGEKALFSVFDLKMHGSVIKEAHVQLSKNRAYLFNNVKNGYTTIDLGVLQKLHSFSSKVVYCWINQYLKKGSFFTKTDKLLSVFGIQLKDRCNLGVKLSRIVNSLKSIGYNVAISKEKKGVDSRCVSALVFSFNAISNDIIKQDDHATPTTIKDTNTRSLDCFTGLTYLKADKLVRVARIDKNGAYYRAWFEYSDKQGGFFVNIKDYDYFMDYLAVNGFIKQDKAMISGVDTDKSIKTDVITPYKENDALIRFKNAFKTLQNANPNPTITPTIKNAPNSEITADNKQLTNFENIVMTSPKHFDYKIISVTQGSLYYDVKSYCDLKKKHEFIRILASEYNNPLDYFYKQGYKFKRYDKKESDSCFNQYTHKVVSLCHNDVKHGNIVSYLKIMSVFKRHDDKIQVELKDIDKWEVRIKPFIADNEKHLQSWFSKYQFGGY